MLPKKWIFFRFKRNTERKEMSSVPIIVASNLGQEEDRQRAQEMEHKTIS